MNCRHKNNIDRWRGVSRPVVRAAAVRVSLLGARIPRHERRPLAVNRGAGTPVRRTTLPTTHGCLATRRDQVDKTSQHSWAVVTNVVGCHDHPAAAALVSDASRGGGTGRRHGSAHRVLSHMPLALYAAAAEEKCFQCQRHSRARIERSMRVLLMLPIASSP